MAIPPKKPFVSPAEYLRLERAAEYKSEYFAGEMFAMAGASPQHALIAANVIGELGPQLKRNPCAPYSSDLRIEITDTGLYTYPDVSVICGPLEFSAHGDDIVTNPTLLVEVLSDSTEAHDRGTKFAHYRTIPAFREYVLVSQKEALVDVFFRQPDETWRLTPVRGLDSTATLESLGVKLSLAEIYDRVEFPELPSLKSLPA